MTDDQLRAKLWELEQIAGDGQRSHTCAYGMQSVIDHLHRWLNAQDCTESDPARPETGDSRPI